MNRSITYIIEEKNENQTIGQFLKEHGFSHPILVGLKKTHEGILLNGRWAYVSERMKINDTLTINIEETVLNSKIEPVFFPLDIIYEDEDLLIVNKTSNMPIHPSMGNHENTLANALAYYFKDQNSPFVFRCINRLDRDTTGLTIIAKNALSAAILGRQVSNRCIHRTYLAICEGNTNPSATIDAPIARANDSTIMRCINFKEGESAVTHYWQLAYHPALNLSLVKLQLETGRTHQIRVHMKYVGHPLIGDFLYNPDTTIIKRQALHSSSLEFEHPLTKEKMHFHAPLPADMKCIFPSY